MMREKSQDSQAKFNFSCFLHDLLTLVTLIDSDLIQRMEGLPLSPYNHRGLTQFLTEDTQ
jgi:hypothetical protein